MDGIIIFLIGVGLGIFCGLGISAIMILRDLLKGNDD